MTTQVASEISVAPHRRVLSGSVILLTGLAVATGANFVYNIAVARLLGATAFGHTTAVYTLLILISAVTLTFQILTAKIVALQEPGESQAIAYRDFHLRSWLAGVAVGLLLIVLRSVITGYLNLPSPVLVDLLAIGAAFYVPLGARRGYIQGTCEFRQFATSLVLEGVMRLFGSLVMIGLGTGVTGVVAANSAAVIIAFFQARPHLAPVSPFANEVPVSFRESMQAAVFFAGQVVINNCDIVVVKHFFPSEMAGIYAAVAMVGRVVFALSWAVVNSMFPISAASRHRSDENDYRVLGTTLLLVLGICVTVAAALWIAPNSLWRHVFGERFESTGNTNFAEMLVLYAVSTGIYALSVVLIAYEMSRKIANTGWIQLLVSGAVISGIYLFHSSLLEVIWVQIAMMVVLLLSVAVPFLVALLAGQRTVTRVPVSGLLRLRRSASEEEVIAEFLKNDFNCPEFDNYQDAARQLVTRPNLDDDDENTLRRALLFVRHGALWRELPAGTQWYEAEIGSADLHQIRVFPRAQWRKVATGDFGIARVAQRLADGSYRDPGAAEFLAKIDRLRERVRVEQEDIGAILLIGIDPGGPFTVLDGNHRFVAALIDSPETVSNLRVFCGLSPRMSQCCWYQTNVATLARYATNMLRYVVYDPEEEVSRLLQRS